VKNKNAAKREFDEAHRLDPSLIPPKGFSKQQRLRRLKLYTAPQPFYA
jgi:hypothetical protein